MKKEIDLNFNNIYTNPLNKLDAIEAVNIFLGLPEIEIEGKPIEYKRIDTFDKEQLKKLVGMKLSLYFSPNASQYNTFKAFIEDQIRVAKRKQDWFNKHLDHEIYYSLNFYIEYLEKLEPLSEAKKTEIYTSIIPNGLFYESELHKNVINDSTNRLSEFFLTENDFIDAVKRILRFNNLRFINDIKNLKEPEFTKELNIQYNLYSRRGRDVFQWLQHTQRLIIEGLIMSRVENRYLLSAFVEWYNMKINQNSEHNEKIKISVKLIGLNEDHQKSLNNENITSPVFIHIKDVLKNSNITKEQARDILLDTKGTWSKELNKNVIEPIINYLERIAPLQSGVIKHEKTDAKVPENPFPKIFINYKGFQIFEAFKTEIITDATEYADYSFLFDNLKKDEFIHDMKHKTFIEFLGKEYEAKFTANYKQFKYSETNHKKATYARYKKQFQ
ncbi:MAG: hypothetical protein M3R36_19290 [Bacteroidota bacterium]|nr:hypothetical protein [Bacteroidota bacterium]